MNFLKNEKIIYKIKFYFHINYNIYIYISFIFKNKTYINIYPNLCENKILSYILYFKR